MADTIKSKNSNVHGMVVFNDDGSNIGDAIPTSGNNPSATYTEVWVGNVKTTTIQKMIGATTYQKVYVENKTTGVTTETAWTEV